MAVLSGRAIKVRGNQDLTYWVKRGTVKQECHQKGSQQDLLATNSVTYGHIDEQ